MAIPAMAAPAVILGEAFLSDHGRSVAPLGSSLILGVALFSFGMQLANGCVSGVLVAAEHGSCWMALAFPGAPVAELSDAGSQAEADAERAISEAISVGPRKATAQDLEFTVRQLVEIALRALSTGINDPFTALAVLDRLGAALCQLASRRLPTGIIERAGKVVLYRTVTDYDGLCDAMFDMIRQNAIVSSAALIRLLDILGRLLAVEPDAQRRAALRRHAALVQAAGRSGIQETAGLAAIEARWRALQEDEARLPAKSRLLTRGDRGHCSVSHRSRRFDAGSAVQSAARPMAATHHRPPPIAQPAARFSAQS